MGKETDLTPMDSDPERTAAPQEPPARPDAAQSGAPSAESPITEPPAAGGPAAGAAPTEPPADGAVRPSSARGPRMCTVRMLLFVVCLAVAGAVLLTFTLTSAYERRLYTDRLQAQQAIIEELSGEEYSAGRNLQLLDEVVRYYSYYAGSMDAQTMLEAAFKAYVAASGDPYAQYYTLEEYRAIAAENSGDYCGIGVTVVNHILQTESGDYLTFWVQEVYGSSSAMEAGLQVGDHIYAVEQPDGAILTLNETGYDQALAAVRGEEGTTVRLWVLRPLEGGGYEQKTFEVTRRPYESVSVRAKLLEKDATVGIVSISGFDLTTPHQFREAVDGLLSQGVQHFVFDVRNNPGGDLQSIKAVLSYFLQEGDLVLSAIDRNGNVAASYLVEETQLTGDYAGCSVSREQIGMYADLDMVVLCNGNTASAAEVFTATLRDYGLARIVGTTTYGKGIMQTTRPIRFEGELAGYIKLTTYAYVTQCGQSYHDVGIVPDPEVELSEEAQQIPLLMLPQDQDGQLQTAAALLLNGGQ